MYVNGSMNEGKALEQRFLEVYEAHLEAVFRHCSFRVFNRERAREIAQEAFCRTWEELAKGSDILNIRAFVYRVANNLIIDESRKKKSPSLEALGEKGFDPADVRTADVAVTLDAKRAREVAARLQPEYREAVLLRYHDNLSPKEIAEITGATPNVISVRIHRGVKMLRTLLASDV